MGDALIQIEGEAPTTATLAAIAMSGYGHFTAMQVRGFAVQGLDLHLRRLDEANRELFGEPLDGERVRRLVRQALAHQTPDASVRVLVQRPGPAATVTVTIRPPHETPAHPWRLRSVPYLRSVAHVKHIGDFGQHYYGGQAERDGYDDALLTGADGLVAESAIANVGFHDGSGVVWPSAPILAGITMQLLTRHGVRARATAIKLNDLKSFRSAFLSNSWGVFPIRQIDDVEFEVDDDLIGDLRRTLASAPWDRI